MNNFISPQSLPYFNSYLEKIQAQLTVAIRNLKIGDVKEEIDFNKTKDQLEKQFLLELVEWEEPNVTDHEYRIQENSFSQTLAGMSRDVYLHKVSFPFKGDSELFHYQPRTLTFTSRDRGILQPLGNEVEVIVELPTLNMQQAVNDAKGLMNMTMNVVADNNVAANLWNNNARNYINSEMEKHRNNLLGR